MREGQRFSTEQWRVIALPGVHLETHARRARNRKVVRVRHRVIRRLIVATGHRRDRVHGLLRPKIASSERNTHLQQRERGEKHESVKALVFHERRLAERGKRPYDTLSA